MERVLIVDTDEAVCEVFQTCLEEEHPGIVVTCLSSGDLAEAALCAKHFDLAVVEVVLPKVCGFKLAQQAVNQGTPVLLMSGDLKAQDTCEAFGYPFLRKPFLLRELISTMRNIRSDIAGNARQISAARARQREAEYPPSNRENSSLKERGLAGVGAMDGTRANILLVETDQSAREGLCMDIEEAGYTVIAAESFEDGWFLLEAASWDLLLTAIDLHGRSGSQLAGRAKAKGIPWIFIADNVVPLARHIAKPQHEELIAQVATRVRSFRQSPARQAA
jgi:DNA-binding response OmpR family regulator